ncbi:MAG: hypothetical protein ACYCT1_08310 [Steroidobacteraceae bacterium]
MSLPPIVRCRGDVGHSWVPLRDLSQPPGHGHLLLVCRHCGVQAQDWTIARRALAFCQDPEAREPRIDSYREHWPIAPGQIVGEVMELTVIPPVDRGAEAEAPVS